MSCQTFAQLKLELNEELKEIGKAQQSKFCTIRTRKTGNKDRKRVRIPKKYIFVFDLPRKKKRKRRNPDAEKVVCRRSKFDPLYFSLSLREEGIRGAHSSVMNCPNKEGEEWGRK